MIDSRFPALQRLPDGFRDVPREDRRHGVPDLALRLADAAGEDERIRERLDARISPAEEVETADEAEIESAASGEQRRDAIGAACPATRAANRAVPTTGANSICRAAPFGATVFRAVSFICLSAIHLSCLKSSAAVFSLIIISENSAQKRWMWRAARKARLLLSSFGSFHDLLRVYRMDARGSLFS